MKKIIVGTVFWMSVVSCSDFLVSEPVEQISIVDQLSNKKGMLQALNGAYYQVRFTYNSEASYIYGDLLSGNIAFTPSSTGIISIPTRVVRIYNFDDQPASSNISGIYSSSYQLINNVNLILQYADALPDATDQEINEIKAEALALRAFSHFQLFKYYAQNYTYTSNASHPGIVYNTEPLKVGVDYPSRKTTAETFALLQDDIDSALSLIQPDKAIPAGESKNFITPVALKTIAAEIALYRNDWQKAYDYSIDIINNSGLQLTAQSDLVNNWGNAESIWELANTDENDSPLSLIYTFVKAIGDETQTWPLYSASNDVYNMYSQDDLRKQLFDTYNISTKSSAGTASLPYHFTKKHNGTTTNIVYRLSLLYFIRAEAALHLGNTAQALADINIIRNRAGLNTLNSITIDVLIEEKRKEFAFENQYFFDLMRNHKNIVRNNGCISTHCSPSYPNDKFVASIPQAALEVNSNMQQNPGY
ncbi:MULTISPECIES: RagB/SusD family nutrient uptake outer membrane protein [unclassified Chryseobacterium]|uniref:RagB/SusD family nutrient uptake outer membrane protein n=1 Tax=unclassified Chryseobacterium TaxID=2593645 RepID=UPI0022698A8E|nr:MULTISPECIES: RagB/SusD family nutrient uptake outer membrane protein [unclassified Chryseobacterium]